MAGAAAAGRGDDMVMIRAGKRRVLGKLDGPHGTKKKRKHCFLRVFGKK
jgi:hypothetical protein